MLFNSIAFAVFLPTVFAVYWALPHRFRRSVLLAASYYFYMSWNAKYVVLILFITAVSYFAARACESCRNKRIPVYAAAVLCLALLFVFKYFNFFSGALNSLFSRLGVPFHPATLKLLLPVGISFYTFQALSYVIDVSRGKIRAENHFGAYAAFISFFPQLVAGPVERTENLLPQISSEKKFDCGRATYGLKLMAWGFFKKMVIADTFAAYADRVFNGLNSYSGLILVLAVFFFAIQIYCDFSGYSDIAVGTASLFGIDLMTNFKSPYFSQSIKEFWSRWHISLSSWFRDYVYIPLGGNRRSKSRTAFNLMTTFLLSGLWHGANWTFIVWGGVHGALQVAEKFLLPQLRLPRLPEKNGGRPAGRLPRALKTASVFVLVCAAWIFFRARSLGEAAYVFRNMFAGIGNPAGYLFSAIDSLRSIGIGKMKLLEAAVFTLVLAVYDACSLKTDCIKKISALPLAARWCVYVAFVIAVLFLKSGTEAQFVYFQF